MSEPVGNDRPVTKSELAEALEKLKTALEQTLSRYATKDELHQAIAYYDRMTRGRLDQLGVELARHANAIVENVQSQIAAIDDKYTDLPPRVKKLEAKVFAPKRRRTK